MGEVMVKTAERAAPGRTTEDRVVVLPNAVVLLDGVTSRRPPDRNGGWYATRLGAELATLLPDGGDLADLLATAIKHVATNHDLVPGDSPASTVAIARWDDDTLDALVLADSPIVAFSHDTTVIADTRLAKLRPLGGTVTDWKNRPGGYWVAEADPEAAHQAVQTSLPRAGLTNVIMATDGVSCGVDDYKIFPNWHAVLDLATTNGPDAVLDEVRAAELSDPDRTRWPRHKTHDDQALALISFPIT
jgi:hypothetical protein